MYHVDSFRMFSAWSQSHMADCTCRWVKACDCYVSKRSSGLLRNEAFSHVYIVSKLSVSIKLFSTRRKLASIRVIYL